MAGVQRHLPEADRIVVLADRDADRRLGAQPFELVPVETLPVPDIDAFVHRYGPAELCFATKPWALAELLRRGYDRAIYLDADIVVYATLQPMLAMLDTASIMLTPHLTAVARDGAGEDVIEFERRILQAGAYNAGFVGIARGPDAAQFLSWWQDKLLRHCLVDVERGLVGDQRWLDLVPGMFDGVRVVRHPGWNFGRWNMDRHRLSVENGEFRVNGEPLVFCHFSGLLSGADSPGQQQNPEASPAPMTHVQALIDDYATALEREGAARYAKLPFAFARSPARFRSESVYRLKSSTRHLLHAVTSTALRRRIQLWRRQRAHARASKPVR